MIYSFIKGYSIQRHDRITRENLRILMTIFYEKTMLDKELAPYFTNELGDDINNEDWQEHIELLADFWLAKILGEKTYIGNFIGAHIRVPHITKESFTIWLSLFSSTADEVYTPEIAQLFKKKGRQLATQFMNDKLHI